MPPTLVKKYGNRRLYDTGDSRYITLEELSAKIRGGTDVRIVDAQTGEDLTQATLAQIILESGSSARLLPVPLLTQLVRLDDDGLAEFFGRYVSSALEMYLQTRRGVQAITQANPLAMWMSNPFAGFGGHAPPPPAPRATYRAPSPEPEEEEVVSDDKRRDEDIAALRRELDELKRSGLGKPGAKRKRKTP
jgi:polyhydroxyalkanoate synthesis repressor PhaR